MRGDGISVVGLVLERDISDNVNDNDGAEGDAIEIKWLCLTIEKSRHLYR